MLNTASFKPAVLGISAAALVLIFYFALTEQAKLRYYRVPDATITTLTGQKIRLRSLEGRPVLITFWSITCPSCVKEIPHLKALYNEFSKRGLLLVAVAMHYDPPNRVVEFAKDQKLNYPVALDPNAAIAHAFQNVSYTPTTFLIAPDGYLLSKSVGLLDFSSTRATLETLLRPG